MKYVVGIDEAGRGPLAGPVTVGAFGTTEKVAKLILKDFFDGKLRDSKKLSEKKREEIFAKLSLLKKEGSVSFEVAHSTPKMIDKKGISKAVQEAIKKSLSWQIQRYHPSKSRSRKALKCTDIFLLKNSSCSAQSASQGISESSRSGISKNCDPEIFSGSISNSEIEIRLDGLLNAPPEFKNQKTITKGDEKDVFIACASIVAKVSRDRLMCKLAKKYPEYRFEIHKGYGTALHQNLIKKLGPSIIHRRSFCKNVI